MKYYVTYLPYIVDDDYDWSYPAPEMQLLWRLDDLQDRLEELIAKDAPYRKSKRRCSGFVRFSKRLYTSGRLQVR